MNNALNDAVAEVLPQPWFVKLESNPRLQPVQETKTSGIKTLFQEYYY